MLIYRRIILLIAYSRFPLLRPQKHASDRKRFKVLKKMSFNYLYIKIFKRFNKHGLIIKFKGFVLLVGVNLLIRNSVR